MKLSSDARKACFSEFVELDIHKAINILSCLVCIWEEYNLRVCICRAGYPQSTHYNQNILSCLVCMLDEFNLKD